MKRFLILLLLSGVAYSQNIAHNKETVTKFLCKNWIAYYATMEGKKMEKMGKMKTLEYLFKSDGTYLANKRVSGKWLLNVKKKRVELYLNGKLKSMVVTLQNNKMVLMFNAGPSAPPRIKTLTIYFKPKT